MLGTVLIIFWIIGISSIISVVKNYSFIKQKVKDNFGIQGIIYSFILIIIIWVISFIIVYWIIALNNFGIIDANNYITGID